MNKIFLVIIVGYVLYYVGNIIYDLFLKKDQVLKEDEEAEIISLTDEPSGNDYSEPLHKVDIDSVEEVSTPNSFVIDDDSEDDEENSSSNRFDHQTDDDEIEEELQKYTATEIEQQEQEKEEFAQTKQDKSSFLSSLQKSFNLNPENIVSTAKSMLPLTVDDSRFDEYLNLANTSVTLVSNVNGNKVYKSVLS